MKFGSSAVFYRVLTSVFLLKQQFQSFFRCFHFFLASHWNCLCKKLILFSKNDNRAPIRKKIVRTKNHKLWSEAETVHSTSVREKYETLDSWSIAKSLVSSFSSTSCLSVVLFIKCFGDSTLCFDYLFFQLQSLLLEFNLQIFRTVILGLLLCLAMIPMNAADCNCGQLWFTLLIKNHGPWSYH